MDDLTADVGMALMRLRATFSKHGLPCPDVLMYSDPRKAYEAIPAFQVSAAASQAAWTMDGNTILSGEMSISGFSFRFEAEQVKRPDPKSEFDDGYEGRAFWTSE